MQNSFFRRNRDLAEDNLNKARVNNGTLIVNDDQYIQNYLTLNSSSIKRLRSFRPQTRYRVLEKELENARNNVKIKVEK
jgi:hypothetical protein